MLKWQRSHLKVVWVLVGVEQEASPDVLRAPGENFQGPDGGPSPGLRVREAPNGIIANFLSCKRKDDPAQGLAPKASLVTPLLGDRLKTMQTLAPAPSTLSLPPSPCAHLLIREQSH